MGRTFKGRPVLAGGTAGQAAVTHSGFNTLAVFYKTVLSGADRAVCSDQDNKDLFGLDLTGKVLCVPKCIGSTSAGAVWDKLAEMDVAPGAVLFSESIDSLSAAGLAVAEVWAGRRIITVDELGSDFLSHVRTGQHVRIEEDGTVNVE